MDPRRGIRARGALVSPRHLVSRVPSSVVARGSGRRVDDHVDQLAPELPGGVAGVCGRAAALRRGPVCETPSPVSADAADFQGGCDVVETDHRNRRSDGDHGCPHRLVWCGGVSPRFGPGSPGGGRHPGTGASPRRAAWRSPSGDCTRDGAAGVRCAGPERADVEERVLRTVAPSGAARRAHRGRGDAPVGPNRVP